MDKIIVSDNSISKELTINKDCYLLINEDVQTKEYKINIINCKATIIDMSKTLKKNLYFENSETMVIEIINEKESSDLFINNVNSKIEYNIIDLENSNLRYVLKEEVKDEGSTDINIASVGYKKKNKEYVVNTSNLSPRTTNNINCFGIVKDKSLVKYDVSSFIKKGAKEAIVKQNSNILLFDKESCGQNNPILLIEENDVKANHGSSIGKIDDDIVFYLCSRGLSKLEATNLICLGKVEYLVNKIDDESIRDSLINKFKERVS